MSDNIRPAIKALIKRGNVTTEEWDMMAMNSFEQEALFPALTNDALAHVTRHMLANCSPDRRRPCVTYDAAVPVLLVPELLRRLATSSNIEYMQGGLRSLSQKIAELDEAMADPARITLDTRAVGGFLSTLDLTETGEQIIDRAIALIKAARSLT